MNISFEEFEKALMNKIMEEDTFINKILKEQHAKAQIAKRKFTGVGFFTDFILPSDVPSIEQIIKYKCEYGDVEAIINGMDGFGFILFIKDGYISCLEGYTWRDEWPEQIINYKLFHNQQS